MPQRPRKNRPQERTAETQKKILDAAEAIFAEQGFEKAQLEEVAARAGYTRGAIYAHFASKEDVFLALMEKRVLTKFTLVRHSLEAEPDVSKRPGIFKRWFSIQGNDQSWGTLMLEFKLYAFRRPESRDKLLRMYELLGITAGSDFLELLFGYDISTEARERLERRLAVLGGILSAVTLESHFRPALLSGPQIQTVIEELFDALIHP